ncbi:hypothetical protein [Undibacterium sp.]|nr:hypothetical protein [Undibacterium sp.]MDP1977345.1 hypothetical protein [Undibacterium sp.]
MTKKRKLVQIEIPSGNLREGKRVFTLAGQGFLAGDAAAIIFCVCLY